MDLPVKFPSETEVILEDVARFRALSPSRRIQAIRDLLEADDDIRRRSPEAAALADQYAEEQELLERRNIREFLGRHREKWQILVDE